MKNIITTISNTYGISEVSGNCIIHPIQENNFLCCYRTTLASEKVKISFDGYCDASSCHGGDSPKSIMDNARNESIEQVRNAWAVLTNQTNPKEEIIDVEETLNLTFEPPVHNHDIVPDVYCTNKYNEPMTESQHSVVYAVAKHNNRTPEAFVQDKLGKDVADLTKGEVSYLSNMYGIRS